MQTCPLAPSAPPAPPPRPRPAPPLPPGSTAAPGTQIPPGTLPAPRSRLNRYAAGGPPGILTPSCPPGLREPRGKGRKPRPIDRGCRELPEVLRGVGLRGDARHAELRPARKLAAQPAAASRSAPTGERLSRELGASTPWCRRGGRVAVPQFPGWSPRVPVPQPPPSKPRPRVSPASSGSGAGSQLHATQLSPFLP